MSALQSISSFSPQVEETPVDPYIFAKNNYMLQSVSVVSDDYTVSMNEPVINTRVQNFIPVHTGFQEVEAAPNTLLTPTNILLGAGLICIIIVLTKK